MPIIDRSYFFGDLNIAQLAQSTVATKVDKFIAQYESDFLEKALGYGMQKAFLDGLEGTPTEDRWIKLRDGSEYTDNRGDLQKWNGFSNQRKESPIANYVYYHILCNDSTWSTGSGEVVPNNENAKRISPTSKMTGAWNTMAGMLLQMVGYLDANKIVYPEWKGWKHAQSRYFQCINDFNI